jgi:hypothetical protein
MDIEVYADHHVRGGLELVSTIGDEVVAGLGSCAERVTSVCVELTVAAAPRWDRTGLRCQLEVQPRGHASVAVTRLAETGDAAVRGAVDDMRHVLERMFRRIDGHRSA